MYLERLETCDGWFVASRACKRLFVLVERYSFWYFKAQALQGVIVVIGTGQQRQ